jgi:hypothetical protein
MRISTVDNITPDSSPPEPDDEYVWRSLAPRLIHPSKLAIIQTLLRAGRPMVPVELAGEVGISVELARYQCRSMKGAGVLEIVHITPRSEGGDEPSYFFPKPPRACSSPSSGAPAAA